MKILGVIVMMAAGLAGCVSRGNFDELPQQDQARFMRCKTAMQPAICGSDQDLMYVTMCIRGAEATYGEQAGPQGRRQWLIEQGCPPPMVNPAPYVAATPAEPADLPMSRMSK